MSIVLLTEHDENIYSITRKPPKAHVKSPRYVSKFNSLVKTERKQRREASKSATMGPPEYPPPDPHNFLKKHSAKPLVRKVPETEKRPTSKVTPVPHTKEAVKEYQDKVKQRTKKNFIVENIRNVLNLKPKEPEKRLVVDCRGDSKDIRAGFEPQHLNAEVLGKTPQYLRRFIKQREHNKQVVKDASRLEKLKCRYITREEKDELLAGLKHNWEELQKQYQGLPILTDTIPKINRKSKLEKDLKQLENDIVLLERHPYVYVYDED